MNKKILIIGLSLFAINSAHSSNFKVIGGEDVDKIELMNQNKVLSFTGSVESTHDCSSVTQDQHELIRFCNRISNVEQAPQNLATETLTHSRLDNNDNPVMKKDISNVRYQLCENRNTDPVSHTLCEIKTHTKHKLHNNKIQNSNHFRVIQ